MAHKVAMRKFEEHEGVKVRVQQKPTWNTMKPYKFVSVLVAVMMIGVGIGVVIEADTPTGFQTVIEPGSMMSQSMIVFKDADTTYLKGDTGAILFSSTSSSKVIQYAINLAQNASGGSIFLKHAIYQISTTLNITKSNITIDAEQGTVLTSSILPILTVWGGSYYDDWKVYNSTNGIRISNIEFRYTGQVTSGKFIYIHKVTPGLIYIPGYLILTNLLIRSTQVAIPTNLNFVGLQIEDMCSARFNQISIAFFGTGLQISTNPMPNKGNETYNNDGLKFDRLQVTLCSQGVFIQGITYDLIFDNLKLMYIALYGVTSSGSSAKGIVFNSPLFEGFDQYHGYWSGYDQKGINATGEYVTVIGGVFNGIEGYGIYRAGLALTVINSRFNWVNHSIHLVNSNATLIGNRYYNYQTIMTHSGVCFAKTMNDGLVLENRGVAQIVNTNYVAIAHGMSASAIFVACSFNSTGYGSYRIYVPGATSFNVYVANPGYYTVYWYAISVLP